MKRKIILVVYSVWWSVIDRMCKGFALFLCWIKDVRIGKNCTFFGLPHFSVCMDGKITIGDNCTFRSRRNSNLFALNHECVISISNAAGNNPIINIGDNCGFSGVTICCFKSIEIGNNVRIGANCIIVDGDFHFKDLNSSSPESIVIEDGAFIGAECIVRKGVTIGKNSVVGMRSMVLYDIPANCVAVGSPAKVIKFL